MVKLGKLKVSTLPRKIKAMWSIRMSWLTFSVFSDICICIK